MGKSKKVKVSKGEASLPNVGLAEQMESSHLAKDRNRHKARFLREEEDDEVRIIYFYFQH